MSTPHFRNRTDHLRDHAEGYVEMRADVTVFYDGLKTEVRTTLIDSDGGSFYGEGFAFCRPTDHYDRDTGEQIAFLRSLKAAADDALLSVIETTQTEGEYQKAEEKARAVEAAEQRRSEDRQSLADLIDYLRGLEPVKEAPKNTVNEKRLSSRAVCDDPDCLCRYARPSL